MCNPLWPMRQFDIASHLFRSYELRKELNKEKDFFDKLLHISVFIFALLLKHNVKCQFVSSPENENHYSHFYRLI